MIYEKYMNSRICYLPDCYLLKNNTTNEIIKIPINETLMKNLKDNFDNGFYSYHDIITSLNSIAIPIIGFDDEIYFNNPEYKDQSFYDFLYFNFNRRNPITLNKYINGLISDLQGLIIDSNLQLMNNIHKYIEDLKIGAVVPEFLKIKKESPIDPISETILGNITDTSVTGNKIKIKNPQVSLENIKNEEKIDNEVLGNLGESSIIMDEKVLNIPELNIDQTYKDNVAKLVPDWLKVQKDNTTDQITEQIAEPKLSDILAQMIEKKTQSQTTEPLKVEKSSERFSKSFFEALPDSDMRKQKYLQDLQNKKEEII